MNNNERSYELAKKTLKLLMKHEIECHPINFEVIYNYNQGYSKSLILAVNEVIRSERDDKDSALAEIHNKLIAGTASADKVEEITSQMADEVDQVTAMISAALGNTTSYGETLGEVNNELDNTIDSTGVKSIVETLMLATADMEQNSTILESKLAASNRQIFELSENLSEVRSEARTDQLTGIANRKHFDETITAEIMMANAEDNDLCVLIGDIDHFKRFNDTYGHQTGDQVLRLVASTLGENVKGRDLVARYGGEEFAIVLTKADIKASEKIGNQIRIAVEGKELVKRSTGENLGSITMCFGAALYRNNETVEDFINRADEALYLAKDSGRNQVKTELDL
ncbi:MAG: diguanylate cyclase [Rhizobiales bacterium]|nr:diguanylate cyclase [Hyphomicrobiales bacterium]